MAPLNWLVTGCSSGLGEIFVSAVVSRGDRVIATARKLSDIEKLKNDNVAILQIDLTDSPSNLEAKIKEAIGVFGGIDVLVNNAAYIEGGPFELVSPQQLTCQFQTNFFSHADLARAILPHFREKGSGNLVWISSMAGVGGEYCASAYCATKHAIEGVADTIRLETEPFGVQTFIFEPGQTRTRLFESQSLKLNIDIEKAPDYTPLWNGTLKMTSDLNRKQPGNPDKCVEIILDMVRDEGIAEGKPKPRRLPLGSDALKVIRKRALENLMICDEWESAIRSVDFTGA